MIKKKRKVPRKELKKIIGTCAIDADLNYLDVSGIKNMSYLFSGSKFNGDISKWNVSIVKDMRSMFCMSSFNGDISKWDVSNVENMSYMFFANNFNGDISQWDVSNVKNMYDIFHDSGFNGDISKWKFNKDVDQTDESLIRLVKLGQEYKEKRELLALVKNEKISDIKSKVSV